MRERAQQGTLMRTQIETFFPFGQTVATRNAAEAVSTEDMAAALARHGRCDWGDLCPEDRRINDESLVSGDRLLSCYRDSRGTTFWIITEADRSNTTVLLPGDY